MNLLAALVLLSSISGFLCKNNGSSPPTTMPSPVAGEYIVYGSQNTSCIIMKAAIQLYLDSEKEAINVPTNSSVTGSCGDAAASKSSITLTFDQSSSVSFVFEDVNKSVIIKNIAVQLNKRPYDKNVTVSENISLPLSKDNTYYYCHAIPKISVKNVSVMLTNLKVQAFNVTDGNFTGRGQQCSSGETTTKSIATSLQTATQSPPTTPQPPNVNNYTLYRSNDTVCLVMQAEIQLKFPYITNKNKNKTEEYTVRHNYYNGTCRGDAETLHIFPFSEWRLSFFFLKSNTSDSYNFNYVLLVYNWNHIPDAKFNNKTLMASADKQPISLPSKKYYKCNAETKIPLTNGASVVLSQLRLSAFKTGNSTGFSGDMLECSADIKTNSIVPIAVGAALAALVVIVLIAYLIGRKRSRRGYESV